MTTTHSTQKPEAQLANSYASHFQIALNNLYLLQIEQIKNRNKRPKS
jgi:hypothetical protein